MTLLFTDEEVKEIKRKVEHGCDDWGRDCEKCLMEFFCHGDLFGCKEYQAEILAKIKDNKIQVEGGHPEC